MAEPDPSIVLSVVDPASPPARWALTQYFHELDERFIGGFDIEGALAESPDSLAAPLGRFVLAMDGTDVVGCGGVVFLDDVTGEIKRMWVSSGYRGRGLASALLARLEAEIGATGRTRVVLDTNGVLAEAITMYGRRGFVPIERYNDNPYAHHWFAKELS